MKNLFKRGLFITCFVLAAMFTFGRGIAWAQEQQVAGGSVADLLSSWENNGYPSYVGAVEGSGTNWIVYLKENTEEYQMLIRNQISSEFTVTFQSCNYSHEQLATAKKQIEQEYVTEAASGGVISVYVRCQEWGDGVKEPRLVVAVESHTIYDKLSAQLQEKYGGMVVIGILSYHPVLEVPAIYPPTEDGGVQDDKWKKTSKSPKIKKARIKKKNLLLQWTKSAGASKYQIAITSNKKLKNAKSVYSIYTKKLTYQQKINKKANAKYYVRIRAYNGEAKRWGKWSTTAKIK